MARPSRTNRVPLQGDLQAKPIRFVDGMNNQPPPFGAHELDCASRQAKIDLEENRAADARALHRLQNRQSLPSRLRLPSMKYQ